MNWNALAIAIGVVVGFFSFIVFCVLYPWALGLAVLAVLGYGVYITVDEYMQDNLQDFNNKD